MLPIRVKLVDRKNNERDPCYVAYVSTAKTSELGSIRASTKDTIGELTTSLYGLVTHVHGNESAARAS